jgi:hypothetical protein
MHLSDFGCHAAAAAWPVWVIVCQPSTTSLQKEMNTTQMLLHPAGTLPPSYANLSAAASTALVLSYNQLQGGIPDAWASRNSTAFPNASSWVELDVANNSRMCGVLPVWFHERFTKSSPAVAARMVQGKLTKVSSAHSWASSGCMFPHANSISFSSRALTAKPCIQASHHLGWHCLLHNKAPSWEVTLFRLLHSSQASAADALFLLLIMLVLHL